MKRIAVPTTLTALLALWTAAIFGLIPSTALGAVPQLINFQGQLKGGSGNPVPNGSYSVAVRIYDVASGLNPALWSDTFSVSTTGGLFNVVLGSEQPLPAALFSNSNLWVGLQIGGDPEATPRTQLTSVPYSARVGTVDGASGGVISGDVSIQSNLSVDGGLNGKSMALGTVTPGPPQVTPFLLKGGPGQTANLMEIQDASGAPMVSVQPDGSFEIKQGLFKRFAVYGHATYCAESLKVDGDAVFGGNFQTSGISEVGGQDALISLSKPAYHFAPVGIGTAPSADASLKVYHSTPTGATLHELGHNLGVRHLTPTTDDFFQAWDGVIKIAHISAMGYLYNRGIIVEGAAGQNDNLQEWRMPLPGGGSDTVAVVNALGNVGIGTGNPHSPLQVDGAIALAITTVTDCALTITTLDKSHSVVVFDGPPVDPDSCLLRLPSAAGIAGRQYTIKRKNSSSTPKVSIFPFPGQNIDGSGEYVLGAPNKYVILVSDGANWVVIGNN